MARPGSAGAGFGDGNVLIVVSVGTSAGEDGATARRFEGDRRKSGVFPALRVFVPRRTKGLFRFYSGVATL